MLRRILRDGAIGPVNDDGIKIVGIVINRVGYRTSAKTARSSIEFKPNILRHALAGDEDVVCARASTQVEYSIPSLTSICITKIGIEGRSKSRKGTEGHIRQRCIFIGRTAICAP